MATDEARLRRIRAALDDVDDNNIRSLEELRRTEALRFANVFDFARPRFRTSVRLRFFGPAVVGHDLPGSTTGIVAEFVEAVKAAGEGIRGATPSNLELFITPNVAPGSTILELVGAPREEKLGTEELADGNIADTPVDSALARVFTVLDQVQEDEPDSGPGEVAGNLGKRLYKVSRDLLRHDVDLDLTWQRPRGSTRTSTLHRGKARALRDLLDRETVTRENRTETGRLVSISTEGQIGVRFPNRNRPLSLTASDFNLEALRELWAGDVEVSWRETTRSHPQRESATTSYELTAIRASDQVELPPNDSPF